MECCTKTIQNKCLSVFLPGMINKIIYQLSQDIVSSQLIIHTRKW